MFYSVDICGRIACSKIVDKRKFNRKPKNYLFGDSSLTVELQLLGHNSQKLRLQV